MTGHMEFTAHNIQLDDRTETKPGSRLYVERDWFRGVERCLGLLFPNGAANRRLADLACLEGGASVGMARLGFDVVGIEVRRANFAKCQFVKERVNLPNLEFVHDTVWNLENYGMFDAILCGGLLYHLDRPFGFLKLMSRCARKGVLVNTHFATDEPSPIFHLSELTENEGLTGRWFEEPPAHAEDRAWAAWDNERSFWIRREELIQAIRDAGFGMVFEQFDLQGKAIAESLLRGYYRTHTRSLFVGVKL